MVSQIDFQGLYKIIIHIEKLDLRTESREVRRTHKNVLN